MNTWIALLRGINVGGHHKLPMKALASALEDRGLRCVRTYIQSGNVVFDSEASEAEPLAERIAEAIRASHGFRPEVLVLSRKKLRRAIAKNPFQGTGEQAKTVHLFFLSEPARHPDREALDALKGAGEEYLLAGDLFYLHAPNGVARSRLAARVERVLGVAATARNWRSVTRILELADRAPEP